ncbi:MAG: cyclic nucleotide-binding domain-containing protein, partial [Spirulinaceae cyanobacterium]
MSFPDIVTWLQERTALGILSQEVLEAIAGIVQEKTVPPQEQIVKENTNPGGLYILREGRLESKGKASLLAGSTLNLEEVILDQPARETVTTLSESQLWFIPAEQFRALYEDYPEIPQTISQQLAQEVLQLESQLNYEQDRQTTLRPYLVNRAKRGIIGKSRYAVKLRKQIKQAAEGRESVLIFGEPGLQKDNVASLVHFSSAYRREPIVKLNCSRIQASGAELFGRAGGKPGLIAALGEGTL